MKEQKEQEAVLLQNLLDAGCGEDVIEKFMACCREKETSLQLQVLCRYRCQLLKQVHAEQQKLDCLDYLIYNIKKQKKENADDL